MKPKAYWLWVFLMHFRRVGEEQMMSLINWRFFMIELSVNGLTKFYGANKIFENISFEVKTGERIGLIGQNGSGKTTIMKILMGKEDYQKGEISLRKGNRIGYLDQMPTYEADFSVMDVLKMAFEQVNQLRQQMEDMEEKMTYLSGDELDQIIEQYARLSEQFEMMHGYETETKLDKITEGLMIDQKMREMPFDKLSGGEKTRVILAKILLEEPDILLLDEPTNHLDLVTIEWLEGFLKEYKGAVLIISHDRYFLDSVTDKIIELFDDHIEAYLGNYSYYVVEKERRFLINLKNYENQQKKIDRMENQIERYRIWGAMRDSEKMFKRAKELEKRLEKIEVMKRPVFEQRKIRLNQNTVGRSGKMVLEVRDLWKGFQGHRLLSDVSFQLLYQDSACIIGENGSGKSTLLKLILGELDADEGTIRLGSQVVIGYLPQQVIYPDEEQTVLEYFSRLHNLSTGAARAQLAKVLFCNEHVNKKIKYLSGGEKSRLRLCSLTFTGVNFLILDEPTNHLDVDSREVLEETLSEFEGTLLVVSHDRYFISKLADRIIAIEDNSAVVYEGDYDYYQAEHKKLLERRSAAEQKTERQRTKIQGKPTVEKPRRQAPTQKNTYHIERFEKLIEDTEKKLNELQMSIERYSADSLQLNKLYEEKIILEAELENAYQQWGELQMLG
jgi:ATPase subunit of ABC transporter with duplicated ATPase domains